MRITLVLLFVSNIIYSQNFSEKVDTLMKGYASIGEFNGCYLLAIDGKIVKSDCYGIKSPFTDDLVDLSTKFHLGSIAKQFTSLAIMLLQEENLLSVNDTITEYFDDLPDFCNAITIKHLLTNTSGMPDYFEFIPYPDSTTNHKVYDCIKAMKEPHFAPGDEYRYCNAGWVLLALLIEKSAKMSYADFLKHNIFGPAGMNNTYLIDIEKNREDNTAVGFKSKGNTDGISYSYDEGDYELFTNGDGGVISTVKDLYKWDSILHTEKLLRKESLDLIYKPVELNNGKIIPYGFGWYTKNYSNGKAVWHGGDLGGNHCMIYRELDKKNLFIVLQNGGSHRNWEIKKKVNRLLNDKQYTVPTVREAISLDTTDLRNFVGVYQLKNGQKIYISLEGNSLKSQYTKRGTVYPIYPEKHNKFFNKHVDAQFAFVSDSLGRSIGLWFHNEQKYYAEKINQKE